MLFFENYFQLSYPQKCCLCNKIPIWKLLFLSFVWHYSSINKAFFEKSVIYSHVQWYDLALNISERGNFLICPFKSILFNKPCKLGFLLNTFVLCRFSIITNMENFYFFWTFLIETVPKIISIVKNKIDFIFEKYLDLSIIELKRDF